MAAKTTYRRFNKLFIVQHIILFVSVLLLIVSGVPLKFPDSGLARWVIALQGGMKMRALIHHGAGLALVGVGIFHIVVYYLIIRHPPIWKRPMMIGPGDLFNIIHHMGYIVGLKKDLPRMGRYTWYEKLDYVGLVWGFVVMGLTGMVMLFMDVALRFIPLAWLQVLWAAHSEEAMLATLFLLIIHMYHVHFNPERFPMNLTWWHGLISREEMEKYHPLELEEIERAEAEAERQSNGELEEIERAEAEAERQSNGETG